MMMKTENKRLIELYDAVNLLMAKLGADGEVNTDTSEVNNIMDILHDIDEGIPHKASASHVASGLPGLTFTFGSDGVWLNAAATGLYTSINLSGYAKEGGTITKGLLEWCKEAARHYA